MSLLRGVGARLSLALALVVAIALGVVYLIVVPSLEDHLISSQQTQLRVGLRDVVAKLPADSFKWPDYVDVASFRTNTRVVVYAVDSISPTALRVVADSRGATSLDVSDDPIAIRAAGAGVVVGDSVSHGGAKFAETAVAVSGRQYVVLLQRSLAASIANIRLVERRLVLAGLIGLIVAACIGFGGAAVFARRIRRLERAADRIAHGQFDEPVHDGGGDELGQLAVAFDHMRERLQGLDGARREFIANASHELRTPIFALSGALELLADEEMDAATREEFVRSMREQTDRLTKLADELLDLSRLDAGKLYVERSAVDLALVVQELVEEFGPVAALGGRDLSAEPGLAVAAGDGERIRQIGRGLVENALRHTPAGSRVAVRASVVGERALLSVVDDGPGVPAAHRERIFERFYRVESGGRASGSGLGLAIAREVALRMGGTVELTSGSGQTVFSLVLPVATAADEDGEAAPS